MPYEEIATRFFIAFAKLEYLMTEKGIAVIDSANFVIKPDWNNLYSKISSTSANAFIAKHQDIVFNNPPQSLRYNSLTKKFNWELPLKDTLTEEQFLTKNKDKQFNLITILLRRVRNNLFHGSKMRDPSEWTNNRLDQCFPILEDLRVLIEPLEHSKPISR